MLIFERHKAHFCLLSITILPKLVLTVYTPKLVPYNNTVCVRVGRKKLPCVPGVNSV